MKEEQIIEAARDLFSTYGYKRVSMDEIAKRANVTKKTVYSYFKSKEELLKYCINDEIKKMKKIVEETEDKKVSFFKNINNTITKILTPTKIGINGMLISIKRNNLLKTEIRSLKERVYGSNETE